MPDRCTKKSLYICCGVKLRSSEDFSIFALALRFASLPFYAAIYNRISGPEERSNIISVNLHDSDKNRVMKRKVTAFLLSSFFKTVFCFVTCTNVRYKIKQTLRS